MPFVTERGRGHVCALAEQIHSHSKESAIRTGAVNIAPSSGRPPTVLLLPSWRFRLQLNVILNARECTERHRHSTVRDARIAMISCPYTYED